MIKLKPETITALRDRLRDRGAPASVARPDINIADAESTLLLEEYGPLCEVMFLMMGADGSVEQSERDVIRGALRELDDRIRTAHFGAMLRSAESARASPLPCLSLGTKRSAKTTRLPCSPLRTVAPSC